MIDAVLARLHSFLAGAVLRLELAEHDVAADIVAPCAARHHDVRDRRRAR